METFDPQGGASLDRRCLIGRIYVGDHQRLLHTKYKNCGPHGFREKDFKSFLHYKSMETLDHRVGASLNPRSLIGRIYIRDH